MLNLRTIPRSTTTAVLLTMELDLELTKRVRLAARGGIGSVIDEYELNVVFLKKRELKGKEVKETSEALQNFLACLHGPSAFQDMHTRCRAELLNLNDRGQCKFCVL